MNGREQKVFEELQNSVGVLEHEINNRKSSGGTAVDQRKRIHAEIQDKLFEVQTLLESNKREHTWTAEKLVLLDNERSVLRKLQGELQYCANYYLTGNVESNS